MATGSAAPSKPWPAVSLAQAHALLTRPGSPFAMEERVIRGVRTRVWKHAMPTLREVSGRMLIIRDGAPIHLSNGRLSAFELTSRVVG